MAASKMRLNGDTVHIFQSMEIRLKIASNTINAVMRCVDKFIKHNAGAVDTYLLMFFTCKGTNLCATEVALSP